MNNKFFRSILAILIAVGLLGAQVSHAQTTYDLKWLRGVVKENDAVNTLLDVWMDRTNEGQWRAEGKAGTFNVPANTVVIAKAGMNAGNPSFEELTPDIFYTAPGGEFGTDGSYRAFQLDGGADLSKTDTLATIDATIKAVKDLPNGEMKETLDVMWSNSLDIINRWGSSGPAELVTKDQLEALSKAKLPLQPIRVSLPGNTLVWGELAGTYDFSDYPGGEHWGLVKIAENLYATTCQGGLFVTFYGYRAMQFNPTMAPDSIIPDMDGCKDGEYPVLDPKNPKSASPLK